ncbi:universal stress protein [Frondihabitans sp. PAMC 28766]|uniref:universal stress protein n=1 Tax=Frondihabitans sp. PAMC 28766 TaxID=1795630 RepID=UPI0009E9158C|nr:universal stress protein [Frondihabitans sp. PAMC 28766]
MTSTLISPPAPEADDRRSTIVVGYDGSAPSFSALERGIRLATVLDTDLLLVTTWTYPQVESVTGFGGWSPEQDAQDIVKNVVGKAFPTGAPPWFRAVALEGQSARILLEQSKGAEMLIVGSRGHGGFSGLLLGSVSSACAEHADCPVLVMHGESTRPLAGPSALPLLTSQPGARA